MDITQLQKLVKQVAKEMGCETPEVIINNRFKSRTLARAVFYQDSTYALIEFSKLSLQLNKDDLIDVIKHELLHIITKAGDDDPKFITACRKNNVKLNGDGNYNSLPKLDNYRYATVCKFCGSLLRKYQRLSGYAKKVLENPELYRCLICNTSGYIITVDLHKAQEGEI